jgi:hypothetical protein
MDCMNCLRMGVGRCSAANDGGTRRAVPVNLRHFWPIARSEVFRFVRNPCYTGNARPLGPDFPDSLLHKILAQVLPEV